MGSECGSNLREDENFSLAEGLKIKYLASRGRGLVSLVKLV